jgi:hypothetical protein
LYPISWDNFNTQTVEHNIALGVSVSEVLAPIAESKPLPDMGRYLSNVTGMLEHFEGIVKDLTKLRNELRDRIIPDKMDNDGIQNINIKGVGRLALRPELQVATKQGMGPDLRDWMIDHDCEDLITETINPSTLKAWVKEQMAKGEEFPDELLNIYAFTRAVLTRT